MWCRFSSTNPPARQDIAFAGVSRSVHRKDTDADHKRQNKSLCNTQICLIPQYLKLQCINYSKPNLHKLKRLPPQITVAISTLCDLGLGPHNIGRFHRVIDLNNYFDTMCGLTSRLWTRGWWAKCVVPIISALLRCVLQGPDSVWIQSHRLRLTFCMLKYGIRTYQNDDHDIDRNKYSSTEQRIVAFTPRGRLLLYSQNEQADSCTTDGVFL